MDEIVKQAMAKWPNVPHCYGWLMLDARGAWRMRDEHAQAAGLLGDPIRHDALLGFINRNYVRDARGCWYFQNGPQRVFVNLESTPFVAHTDADGAFRLHTGEALAGIDAAWFDDRGQLLLQQGERIALVDDRDLVNCLSRLRFDDAAVDDALLLAWIAGDQPGALTLVQGEQQVGVQRIGAEDVPERFGFVRMPAPDAP